MSVKTSVLAVAFLAIATLEQRAAFNKNESFSVFGRTYNVTIAGEVQDGPAPEAAHNVEAESFTDVLRVWEEIALLKDVQFYATIPAIGDDPAKIYLLNVAIAGA